VKPAPTTARFKAFTQTGVGCVLPRTGPSIAFNPDGRLIFPLFTVVVLPELEAAPCFPRIELKQLFDLAARPEEIPWQPFKAGVDIHRLYGDGVTGPTAALIRFREAGRIPLHRHEGYEHIFVLAGSQRDQNGSSSAGTLMINPPGTTHSVVSEAGCIVLAIYEKPVAFLEPVLSEATAPPAGER
jgi:quercetin dioxygenase-like cupin family protein